MALALRPVVSAPLGRSLARRRGSWADLLRNAAGCCTVLSVFGVVILTGTPEFSDGSDSKD